MRILVFEFITGGGLADQALPASLLQEGYLMRNALLDDLCALTDVELLVLRDERIALDQTKQNARLQYLTIFRGTDIQALLFARQSTYDAVWLIAPETEGILAFWCYFFNKQGKYLATSAQKAVEICQDKFRTFNILKNSAIPCVPSRLFNSSSELNATKSVLKVNNSVGCDEVYLMESEQHWHNVLLKLRPEGQYILQPYISGKALSLSCLFFDKQAYFICCNEQHMKIDQQQFELIACTVNVQPEKAQTYQILCQKIAEAMPLLFGYVGIDFIQTDTGENLILEINPRLTSSYAGIKDALGINVAELVLGMLNHQSPILNRTKNQQVSIEFNQGNHYGQ